MGLNVDACFHVAREVARRSMIPNNSGKIINIASIAARDEILHEFNRLGVISGHEDTDTHV